ncbi:LPXTG cell wall anchor domain-containing protein [uncultured Jatrophihabitans sp.]|uniref:LPXTG cell wall anchor domain-containing protein n=1 Tax=uncultured Jatrophihabitans sp. TaxID=1610747 RepID=UPI0035CBD31E
MSIAFRRGAVAAAVGGLALVGVQLIGMAAAGAHVETVAGHATCLSNGAYTVAWTVTNTYASESETITATGHAPASSTLSESSFDVAANDHHQVTQTGIPAGTGSATLSVHGLWHPDNFTQDVTGTVNLSGVCSHNAATGTATAPSAANGGCVNHAVTAPSITIPAKPGVTYLTDNHVMSAGRHAVKPGTHTVVASSKTQHLVGTVHWTYHLTNTIWSCAPDTHVARPVTPTVSQAQCTGSGTQAPHLTLPDTRGITYSVSRHAPYHAGETVTVTAKSASGYTLGNLSHGWTAVGSNEARYTTTFHSAPSCLGTAGSTNHNGGSHATAASDTSSVPTSSTASSSSPSGLASTGVETSTEIAIALGLLVAGVGCLMLARRPGTTD